MADVLFWYLTHDSLYHKGIAYISAFLKKDGHSTALITLDLRKSESELQNEIYAKIADVKPLLIAVSSMTCHWNQLKGLLAYAKSISDIQILVGGWHPTLSPEEVIREPSIDFVCLGEGEKPALELLEHLKRGEAPHKIQNIWTKKDSLILKNPLRPLIQNLDALPLPDRDLFSFQNLVDDSALSGVGPEGPKRVAVLSTGRGCLYSCAYCCNAAYRNRYHVNPRNFVRKRGVPSILAEIEKIIDQYDPDWLEFWEENFIFDHQWLVEFSRKYRQRFRLPFSIPVRPNEVQKDEFRLLREANCKLVYMGVECGNEAYRKSLIKRNLSNDQIINAFRLARENNIATLSFNMVGLPLETELNIEETLGINEIIQPDFFGCYIYTPFPGTALYDLAQQAGLLKREVSPVYYAADTPNVKGLDDEVFQKMWRRIETLRARFGELRRQRYPNLFD
jgi:anaerobic magnesium-protoporphyrin IX monomethyl ester cyclase